MRIPGALRDNLFYLRILTITSVLSILLQIQDQVKGTSVESTFGHLENHLVKKGESNRNLTGKSITVLVRIKRRSQTIRQRDFQ